MRSSHNHNSPRIFGFMAGLCLVVLCGWALFYAGHILAGRFGWREEVALPITSLLSLALFVFLEQGFWLSRLMGLRIRQGASPLTSALMMWLFGVAWLFVKASIIDSDQANEQRLPAGETEQAPNPKSPPPPRDPAREVVETVVFVVVLVLLLKLFVTEAFVIPTGSMAETLYGYHQFITCPKCGHMFPVNSHDEAEGNQQTGRKMPLYGYCCPNCRYQGHTTEMQPKPSNTSGDRVLVLKPLYHIREPKRGEVVVFKWPEKPQDKLIAQNYIKRAMGFGGETIGVYRGDLFATKSLAYPADALDSSGQPVYPRPDDPLDLWRPRYMYSNVWDSNPLADHLFELSRETGFSKNSNGGFQIIRKGEEQVLADRRIVWDNDHQSDDFVKLAQSAGVKDAKGNPRVWWTRWYDPGESGGNWTTNDAAKPAVFRHEKPDLHWLRYRHLSMRWKTLGVSREDDLPETTATELAHQQPTFIDNFLGYNAGRELDPATGHIVSHDQSGYDKLWVGDLILECKATFEAGSKVTMELSRGVNRFQARFEQGKVTLKRIGAGEKEFGEPSRPCKVGPGSHELRFGNVDCRLWVWVDGKRVDFGDDGDYTPPTPDQEAAFKDALGQPDINPEGWTRTNDVLAPAGIGAEGAVGIQNIKLHRDVYYTRNSPSSDQTKADIFYVQPGHYMCMGDNSAQSSDSRKWGLVPERLMLGRAVFIFFPVFPENRLGFIK